MKKIIGSFSFIVILVAFVLAVNVEFLSFSSFTLIPEAEAVVGRPATPVSYAGVARRSPVGVNRVGNRGGPVNRVGRR